MPTDDTQQQQGAPPLQEAIKLLNLRLPRVLGAQAPVNQALLGAPGLQGGSDLQFLRQLLGQSMPQPQAGGAPSGGAPLMPPGPQGGTTPRVVVGRSPQQGGDYGDLIVRPGGPPPPGGNIGGSLGAFSPEPVRRPRDRGPFENF